MHLRWGTSRFLCGLVLILSTALAVAVSAYGESTAASSSSQVSSSAWPFLALRRQQVLLPQQERPHALDDGLYASIAAYRTLDYFSTEHALAGGAHEVMLPQWVVGNRGVFVAFEGLATTSEIGGSIWLIHHGHRKLARAMNVVSIGLGTQAVVHNYTEPLLFRP